MILINIYPPLETVHMYINNMYINNMYINNMYINNMYIINIIDFCLNLISNILMML